MPEKFPYKIEPELHSPGGIYESDTYVMTKDCVNVLDGTKLKSGKKYSPTKYEEKLFFQQLCVQRACVAV